MRLLISSIHCYLDPSSGAALCTRELLELLAARGMDCRVLTTGILDPERETSLDEMLAALELPDRRFQAELRSGRAAEVIDLAVNGVRVTLTPTVSSRAERSPDPRAQKLAASLFLSPTVGVRNSCQTHRSATASNCASGSSKPGSKSDL